jgi:N-acetylneuraminic acid mutarotase
MRWLAVLTTLALLITACDSEQTPTATASTPPKGDFQAATGLAAISSVSTNNSLTADGALATQLAILSTTFVRGKGSPKADAVTFAATSGALYIVDLDDLGSQGADGSVVLNGVTLLAPRTAADTGARHVTTTVALNALNALVVRLLGKPGSVLQVAITPLKPVTLDAVTFTSPTTILIGGPGATFNSTITNHTAVALSGIAVQSWIQQGTARRAASGQVVFCNAAFGVLPPGTCIRVGDAVFAMNGSAGTGTLVPGSATAIIQILQQDGGSVVLDSLSVPITLIGPPLGDFWTTEAPLPTPRNYLAAGVVNGVLYAVGGSDNNGHPLGTVEAYDPVANNWTAKAPLPTPRAGLATGVVNGVLYAVGGVDQNNNALGAVEAYDPVANSWSAKAPLPTPRGYLAAGVVNGVLFAVGGSNQNGPAGTVEAYDPVANSWTAMAPMPTPRLVLAAGVVNGVLYAVGGAGNGILATVEAYDPVANSWTAKASLATPRGYLAADVVNGTLYAVGGLVDKNGLAVNVGTVEAYDPVANSWTAKAPLLTPRASLAAGALNGVLYAVSGTAGGGLGLVGAVEAYHP